MTSIAGVVAMRGLLRLLSGRGEDVMPHARATFVPPPRGFGIRARG